MSAAIGKSVLGAFHRMHFQKSHFYQAVSPQGAQESIAHGIFLQGILIANSIKEM